MVVSCRGTPPLKRCGSRNCSYCMVTILIHASGAPSSSTAIRKAAGTFWRDDGWCPRPAMSPYRERTAQVGTCLGRRRQHVQPPAALLRPPRCFEAAARGQGAAARCRRASPHHGYVVTGAELVLV